MGLGPGEGQKGPLRPYGPTPGFRSITYIQALYTSTPFPKRQNKKLSYPKQHLSILDLSTPQSSAQGYPLRFTFSLYFFKYLR